MADVQVERRYGVPASRMWERIGDPASLATWHPGVETTELVDGGRTRINTVVGGGKVSETILERGERRYTFRIDDSPLPMDDFVATLGVRDDGTEACVVTWEATYEPDGVSASEAAEIACGFFQAGLETL